MKNILVVGAGKIGVLIANMLVESKGYGVYLADVAKVPDVPGAQGLKLDITDHSAARDFLGKTPIDVMISCLPYFYNQDVASLAKEFNLHYFDLTEDTAVTDKIKGLAEDSNTAFVPQCGLAPGFIGIAANSLIKQFDSIDSVKMRVGALPVNSSNALRYALTWSTDGLINEYGNPCFGIEKGKPVVLHPLGDLESIEIDGMLYEAFNTSGGLGSLGELYADKVHTMNYKTLRYPGHCEKIRLLMNDLRLNDDRDTLKRILENAVPRTKQDVVLIYVSVTGQQNGELIEQNYFKKVYPQKINGQEWSAIQVTTASGLCSVMDLVLQNESQYKGFVLQEQFSLEEVLKNRFGKVYA